MIFSANNNFKNKKKIDKRKKIFFGLICNVLQKIELIELLKTFIAFQKKVESAPIRFRQKANGCFHEKIQNSKKKILFLKVF